eukprot:CAMPEP_0116155900 /NCGR_PEP_ID=MMETSP0329-20121206/22552_1 /TAXON_ID=697910 /ORGANISM="Pseudo-nitzschia arenysensis, Strain B593" /LENGTH=339 /DNA_ID=CAMNT_0003652961 /DNA_START=25 /DNA_END=1045 /DNA_ORIENTATION=-
MRNRPSTLSLLLTFLCLTFITEGRLFSPTRTFEDKLSAPESEKLSTDVTSSECKLPPFSPPFVLPDPDAFDVISSCPFDLHRQATGTEIDGCFPIYNISGWENPNLIIYEVYEFKGGVRTPLVLEKSSTFATSEEFDIVSISNAANLAECKAKLNYKVEGINGKISGGKGTVGLAAKESTILIPVGGCETYSRQSVSKKEIQDSCTIKPNGVEGNACLEKCYSSIESNYIDEIDKLNANRSKRISKNNKNREIVIGKLLNARASQLSTAFARCKCKHDDQDLGQCFLRTFLDTLVTENEDRFQVEESFHQHLEEVEAWFQDSQNRLCDSSARAYFITQK